MPDPQIVPVSAETMRELDRMASISGISVLSLMENAGKEVAKKAAEVLQNLNGDRIAFFCGKGNNGGDGFVAARKLRESGFHVDCYLFGKKDGVKKDAAVMLKRFTETGGNVKEIISDADIKQLQRGLDYSLIIDSLLGTGFSGAISGHLRNLIELINSSSIPILAVDSPSGLNCTTGEISPVAITANWTISFALGKKGFYKKSGPACAGKIQIANIGFSRTLLQKAVRYEKNICETSK